MTLFHEEWPKEPTSLKKTKKEMKTKQNGNRGTIVFFAFVDIMLIFGSILSFCVMFSINCTPPEQVKPLFGIAFVFAVFAIYKVGGTINNLIKN